MGGGVIGRNTRFFIRRLVMIVLIIMGIAIIMGMGMVIMVRGGMENHLIILICNILQIM